jgi:hypothetical protein
MSPPVKFRSGLKSIFVMVQAMDAYFETSPDEILPYFMRNPISSFRHEVERRAETSLLIELREPKTPLLSNRGIDIMRDHEGESFSVRPPFPTFGRTPGAFKNWPHSGYMWQLPSHNDLPKADLRSPRNDRLDQVVKLLEDAPRSRLCVKCLFIQWIPLCSRPLSLG